MFKVSLVTIGGLHRCARFFPPGRAADTGPQACGLDPGPDPAHL